MGKLNVAKYRRRRWWLGAVGLVLGGIIGGFLDGLVLFLSYDFLAGNFTWVGALVGMGSMLLYGERKQLFPTDNELTEIQRDQEMNPLGLDEATEPLATSPQPQSVRK